MSKSEFIAGYGVSDITQPVGEFCSFRLAPNKRSLGVQSRLYTHALYLSNGHEEMILISVDCLVITGQAAKNIKQAVQKMYPLAEGQILLAATHAHNGAETMGEEPLVDNSAQLEHIQNGVCDAVSAALKNKFTACSAWRKVDLPGVAKNRFAARTGGDVSKADPRGDFFEIEDVN